MFLIILFQVLFFSSKIWVNAFTLPTWSKTSPNYKKALCHSDMLHMKNFSCIVINLGPGMKFQEDSKSEPYFLLNYMYT